MKHSPSIVAEMLGEESASGRDGQGDPRDTKSWTTHNIPKDVWMAADQWEKLAPIATGGDFDFVSRSFGDSAIGIIVSGGDAGSPSSLEDTADVILYLDESWTNSWRIGFPSASSAIEWLGSTDLEPMS